MTATMTRPDSQQQQGIPYGRLLRVEWRKASDTRSARWLLAITATVSALVMLIPLLARNDIDQTWASYLQFPAIGLTTLLPVVAILTLTTEWTQRTVLTTFTQEPRRERVIGAKVWVSIALGVVGAAAGMVITAVAAGVAIALGRDLPAHLGVAKVGGFALCVLANVLIGVALGALLHNTAAAIVAFFAVPTAIGLLGGAVGWVSRWLDPGTTFNWLLDGDLGGHVPQLLVSTVLWIIVPLTAGMFRTARREIV